MYVGDDEKVPIVERESWKGLKDSWVQCAPPARRPASFFFFLFHLANQTMLGADTVVVNVLWFTNTLLP